MNELLALRAFLSNAHLTNPRLALANAVAWLDPHYHHTASVIDDDDPFETDLEFALEVCQRCFPDVYAGAMQLRLQGAAEHLLNTFICDGVNAYLTTDVDDIEVMRYGIPLDFLGINWTEPEFFDNFPDLVDILTDFGVTPDNAWDSITHLLDIAQLLHNSLEGQPGQTYLKLLATLSWLFAGSGNSLVDMSSDDFWESGMEYDDWTPQNIQFTNDMTEEALRILEDAYDGLTLLRQDTELRTAFRHNILVLASRTGDRRINHNDHNAQRPLQWPGRP